MKFLKNLTKKFMCELLGRHDYVGACGTTYIWCRRCDRFFGRNGEQVHHTHVRLE